MPHDKKTIIQKLTQPGIIAIIRARTPQQTIPITQALIDGGITAIEITMTTPNALQAIRETANQHNHHALIGVGTILHHTTAQKALDAGAQFIVTPILKPEIITLAHQAHKPTILGAYTPTEAQQAFQAGSDFIKLFPADQLGPTYIKAILTPLPHLKIIPTGGITLQNMQTYLQAGSAALGIGTSLITNQILTQNNWQQLTQNARAFTQKIQTLRQTQTTTKTN